MIIKSRNVYTPGPEFSPGELMTKQAFKEQCDINFIVKQHASTGVWSHLNPVAPTYGDNTGAEDLQGSIQAVRDAQAEFDALPATVRALAGNNPVQLLEMLGDEDAFAELVAVGLPVEDRAPAQPPAAPPGGSPSPPSGPPSQPADPPTPVVQGGE